jgi:hypothetical protein
MRRVSIYSLSLGWFLMGTLALAEPEAIDPNGRPENFEQGQAVGYAVWYEAGYWEVRMTSKDRPGVKRNAAQVYTGSITFEGGTLDEGQFAGLELKKKAKESDWIRVHPGRKGFDFHFIAKGKTDSFKFKASRGADAVQFNLLTSGDDAPERVRIGKKGKPPSKVPFEFPAHPMPPAE